jgi:hypothetical protein
MLSWRDRPAVPAVPCLRTNRMQASYDTSRERFSPKKKSRIEMADANYFSERILPEPIDVCLADLW